MDAEHSGTSQRMVHHNNTQYNNTYNAMTFSLEFTADNKVEAGRAGAIEAIVSAMKTHINNAGVCEQGCGALRNITVNGTSQ